MTASTRQTLTGWGRNLRSTADVEVAGDDEALARRLGASGPPILARGNGRSYGDAALNAGGVVLDMRSRRTVCRADWERGIVTVEAGMLLVDLLELTEQHGWTVPVVPGTSQVTVGGAVASDVHGKNHRARGTFGGHLGSVDLLRSDGQVVTLRPEDPGFRATVGGMGLTGVVLRVELCLIPRGSGRLLVRRRRTADIDAALGLLAESTSEFAVAWVDLLSRRGLGRSIVSEADPLPGTAVPTSAARRPRMRLPLDLPARSVNARTVALFNTAYFHRAPVDASAPQETAAFHYPLDALQDWNRAYGAPGFVQYQFVVPPSESETLVGILLALRASGVPGFLAVLKRMGPARAGLLSFPMPGWSLAVDVPAQHPDLRSLLRALDQAVVRAGGRVYLTKDSCLDRETFEAMYPQQAAWQEIRDDLDPRGRVGSDLGRRLGLVRG